MNKNKLLNIMLLLLFFSFTFGCAEEIEEASTEEVVVEESLDLINYVEALELFEEGVEAEIYDIETGITFTVRRVVGGYNTIADVETVSLEDTQKMLEASGGDFSIVRRAVIVTIGEIQLAASIAPFEHSGSEDYAYGEIIDNRSGSTGTGINLDSIRDNGLIGVVDIYFYNSLIPGLNRIDERHQEMVLEAYEYLQ